MIQHLPRPPSTAERFARAIAGATQSASEEIPKYMQLQKAEKEKIAQRKAVAKALGDDFADLPEDLQKEAFKRASELEVDEAKHNRRLSLIDKIAKDRSSREGQLQGTQSNQSLQQLNNEGDISQQQTDPFLESELFAAAGEHDLSQVASKRAEAALRDKREITKAKERKLDALRKETLPIRTEISNRGDAARRGIENKEKQIQLIDTGKLDDPTMATIFEAIPMHLGARFLSPETVEYKSGLVQGYGDLKNIFSGATRVKEVEILEQKIADLYLTDQQKKAILKSSIDTQKADIIREEAAAELEDKPLSLLQYRKEVEKIAKPKLDALFIKILDEQNAIIKDAENHKKIELNDSDPEDVQIIDQILQEANGDWREAEKLAKKKGYKF